MKVVATIEARFNSTRLPGKVLKPIMGRPMLELLVERVKKAKLINEVIIATTLDASCDPIAELSKNIGIACFRGSEDDVLDRVLKTAKSVNADIIVELTGDNPLVDSKIIDNVIAEYMLMKPDYCSTHLERYLPIGIDVQVFSTAVLEKVAGLTNQQRDREHVSIFIYEHPELFTIHHVKIYINESIKNIRLTVDTIDDFNLITFIFQQLYSVNDNFSIADIEQLYKSNRILFAQNQHVKQKV